MTDSSVSWSLAQDLSSFPSVAGLHEVVGHPVVVVLLSITEGFNRDEMSNSVSDEGGSEDGCPLLPSEGTCLEVRSHSWAGSEDCSSSTNETEHLDGETSVTTLSLEEVSL